jgi:predicted metalloprotease
VSSGACRSLITTLTVTATLAAATACAQEVDTNPLETGAVDGGGPPGSDQPVTPESVHDTIQAALNDVVDFWEQEFPETYGGELEPIQDFVPYGSNTDPLPCGDPSYDEIANNAFYCPEEDLIAWDEEALMPQLAEDFGPFTVAIVLAHEFGHAVQPRADVPLEQMDTIVIENQADCFAGAWSKWVEEGNSQDFEIGEDTLDAAMAGIVSFADEEGTTAADPMAHGLGFDRVSAFQDGWENGTAKCATYPEEPPPSVEVPFSGDELVTGGDMPLEDEGDQPGLITLIEQNLNAYFDQFMQSQDATWTPVEDLVVAQSGDDVTCNGESLGEDELEYASLYCEDENIVVLDGENLVPELEQLGDFAVGAEITRLYSRAALLQLGVDGDDRNASLLADCLLGVWSADNFPDPTTGESKFGERIGDAENREDVVIYLSPGDLDEAIIGFLNFGETLPEDIGTAFERAAALRQGFLPPGLETCEQEYGDLGGG